MGLAQNLKRMRAAKGLQQAELGDAVGVSEITIRKYKAGERCPKQPGIEALANALLPKYHGVKSGSRFFGSPEAFSWVTLGHDFLTVVL